MAGQAEIEKYNELISALNSTKQSIGSSVSVMNSAVKTADNQMGSDSISAKASARVYQESKKYQEVMSTIDNLVKKLEAEVENIKAVIDAADDM